MNISLLEQQAILLIYKYIDTIPSLKNVRKALDDGFNSNFQLGETILWNGSTTKSSLSDISIKYENLSPLTLLNILQKSNRANIDNSLMCVDTCFAKSKENYFLVLNLRIRFVQLCCDHIAVRSNIRNATFQLEKLRFIEKKEVDDDLIQVLSDVGSKKYEISLAMDLDTCEDRGIQIESEKKTIIDTLSANHSMTMNISYDVVDNGLQWLCYREVGKLHYRRSTTLSLGCGSMTSPVSATSMMQNRFKLLWTSSGHMYHPAYSIIVDRSGRFAITGADDYLVKVWDIESGNLVRTCQGHQGCITILAISHDNSLLASACTNGYVRVWRFKDGRCVGVLRHDGEVSCLQFDPLTCGLVSTGDDGKCIIWDISQSLHDISSLENDFSLDVHHPLIDCSLQYTKNLTLSQAATANISSSSSDLLDTGIDDIAKYPLFSWRKKIQHSPMLVLPHLKDEATRDLQQILSMDVCPADSLIVTGCADGIARVWRFNDSKYDESLNIAQSTRSNKRAVDMSILERLKSSLPSDDYRNMEVVVNHLLLRLEGHFSGVTDARFSNLGERLLTASSKDGTVRIWSFTKDMIKTEVIILNMNDDSDFGVNEYESHNRLGRRNRAARNVSKSLVYNACWSCDDRVIVVLHSCLPDSNQTIPSDKSKVLYTKIRVHDSLSGEMLSSMMVSEATAHVLAMHPLKPSIIFTSGEDGLLNVWDIEAQRQISSQYMLCPDDSIGMAGKPATIVDAAFTPDGQRILASDNFGRVIMLGSEDSERFEHVKNQQYFSRDYSEFMFSDDGTIVDVGTQLPTYLVPAGAVCRSDGTPYAEQPVYLTSPSPLSRSITSAGFHELISSQKDLFKAMHRSFLATKRQKHGTCSKPQWQSNAVTYHYKNSASSVRKNKEPIIYVEEEADDRSDGSFDEGDYESDNSNRRRGASRNRAKSRYAATSTVRNIRTTSSRTSRTATIAEERSRRIQRRSQLSQRVISSDNEGTDDSSLSETDDDLEGCDLEMDSPKQKEKSLPPVRKKNITVSSNKEKSSAHRVARKPKHAINENELLPWSFLNGSQTVPLDAQIDRSWLLLEAQSDQQYIPQIGDRVLYFPQGHMLHLNDMPEARSPPWLAFPTKWPVVECVVDYVKYSLPSRNEYSRCPSVIAHISLTLIGVPVKWGNSGPGHLYTAFSPPRTTRNSSQAYTKFDVSLRNLGAADFLVPWDIYYKAAITKWEPQMKFSTVFNEIDDEGNTYQKLYEGIISRISDKDYHDWHQSPWESLEIEWKDSDDNNSSRISAWDAIPFIPQIVAEMQSKILEPLRKSLLMTLDLIMADEQFSPFLYPVDSSAFGDYYCIVPLPIHIELIRLRLQNKFYRQIESFMYDVSMIYENCLLYNRDDAPIINDAKNLVQKIHASIDSSIENLSSSSHPIQENKVIESQAESSAGDGDNNSNLILRLRTRSSYTKNEPAEEESNNSENGESEDEHSLKIKLRGKKRDTIVEVCVDEKRAKRVKADHSQDPITIRMSTRGSASRTLKKYDVESPDETENDHRNRRSNNISKRQSERNFTHSPQRKHIKCEEAVDAKASDTSLGHTSGKSSIGSSIEEDSSRAKRSTRRSVLQNVVTSTSFEHAAVKTISFNDLLNFATENDAMGIFHYPVDFDEAPGYSEIIKQPMDLSTIKKKLDKSKYKTILDMESDINLMFDNCELYNDSDSEFFIESRRQRKDIHDKIHS